MSEFDEIVIPVDGSEDSHRAARYGARLASALNVPINLVYVIPVTPESIIGMSRLSREEIDKMEHQQAAEIISGARDAIGDAGMTAGEIILLGDAAEEILGYIDKHPKTMVVIGRRGLSKFKTLMLGSVSEKVIRYAKGAVTIVN
jgi:nucleotide-binding universal stress UspA family protein